MTPKLQPKTANLGPKLRASLEGTEKLCTRCDEWWPADDEFFQHDANGAGGLFYCCKACLAEWRRDRRSQEASVSATDGRAQDFLNRRHHKAQARRFSADPVTDFGALP